MNRWLLDTHVLIWALVEPERLDTGTRRLFADQTQTFLFSAASIWEIAIKTSLARADFKLDPTEIAEEAQRVGFIELPVHARVAALVAGLAPIHRDPFDRLLIAQAIDTPARLLTADAHLPRYSDQVTLIRPPPPRA